MTSRLSQTLQVSLDQAPTLVQTTRTPPQAPRLLKRRPSHLRNSSRKTATSLAPHSTTRRNWLALKMAGQLGPYEHLKTEKGFRYLFPACTYACNTQSTIEKHMPKHSWAYIKKKYAPTKVPTIFKCLPRYFCVELPEPSLDISNLLTL